MANLRLIYFQLRGRAEAIRLFLHSLSVEFDDHRVESSDEWQSLKPAQEGFRELLESQSKSIFGVAFQDVVVVLDPVESPEIFLGFGNKFLHDVEIREIRFVERRRSQRSPEMTKDGGALSHPRPIRLE